MTAMADCNRTVLLDPVPGYSRADQSQFTTTHWSVVLRAGKEWSLESASALEDLCRTYWYPLYAYARRQGHSPADGQDLTQEFFAVFLEKNYVAMANPERGRFRSFLLASFKNFLTNAYHRSRTIKRGGGCAFVSWDEADAEARYRNEPASQTSPDKLFEQAWALAVLEKALVALRREYVRAGKELVFEALGGFLSGRKSEATYATIGEGLQMSEAAVKMAVSRLRHRYGQMLRNELANAVNGPAGVEEELRHLLRALS